MLPFLSISVWERYKVRMSMKTSSYIIKNISLYIVKLCVFCDNSAQTWKTDQL